MKIPFRQGIIACYKIGGTPRFLAASSAVGYVDFVVGSEPTTVAFAFAQSDYLMVFDTDVQSAWGPVTSGVDNYLYWDIDVLSGVVSRRITTLQPLIQLTEPGSPTVDQLWFDLTTTTMKVWSGSKWLPKIIVLAGRVPGGVISNLVAYNEGSQVGLQVPSDPGFIMQDPGTLRPLFRSFDPPQFLTDRSPVLVRTSAGTSGILTLPTNSFIPVRATENIPRFSLVYFSGADSVALASSDPSLIVPKTPIGVVQEELDTNEIGVVTQAGEITWDQWDWSAHVGKPLYCGFNGEITTTRPSGLLAYRIGFVKNARTILFQVDAETQPQLYTSGSTDVIVSGVPPLTSAFSLNGIGERVWTISLPPATALGAGHMTAAQAILLNSFDTRITTAEGDILNRALLSHTQAISTIIGLQDALDLKSNVGHNHDLLYLPLGYTGFDTRYAALVHNHSINDVTGLQNELNLKADLTTIWSISSVSGLAAQLAAKANLSHTHVIADVSGLQAALDALSASLALKANLSHTHVIADVVGLQTALDNKAPLVHSHIISDVTGLQTALADLTTALAGKADLVHVHSISDVTGLTAILAGKSDIGHAHVIGDVTGLQTTLDNKTDLGHAHSISDVTALATALAGKSNIGHTLLAADITDFDTADVAFVFQVGAPILAHTHYALMSTAQAKALIHAVNTDLPATDAAQPFVVLSTEENGNPAHQHDITVYFDYVNATFIVTNITNNAQDNHVAKVIGDGTPVTSLPTQVVVLAPLNSSAFVLRTVVNEFTYLSAYSSYLSGIYDEWQGEFDQVAIAPGVAFLNTQEVSFSGVVASEATVRATVDVNPATNEICEFVFTGTPQAGTWFFVGAFIQAFGPPFNPEVAFGGPLSNYYWSSDTEAKTYGFGTTPSLQPSLAPWSTGDVIGVIFNSTLGNMAFFRNGVLIDEVSNSNSTGVFPMCGFTQTQP